MQATRERLELPVQGMSCASCAGRVERQLNGLDGVRATVNLATERATVEFDPTLTRPRLIVEAIEASGYHARLPQQPAPPADDGLVGRRLLVSAVLSLPVLLTSMIAALQFDGWQWVDFALASVVVFWCGRDFHRAAIRAARHRSANMDSLISIGTLAAWGWSAVALAALGAGDVGYRMAPEWTLTTAGTAGDDLYLEVAAVVTTLVLAGRLIEARAKRRAGAALRALLELGVREVTLLRDGREQRVAATLLAVGDRFVVAPGERVATDGLVLDGRSHVDCSLLTGESLPVETGAGDRVTGSTVNGEGRLLVLAEAVGADTAVARIGRMVEAAQSGKAEAQRLADRVSAVFVPAVIVIAVAALGFWLLQGAGAGKAFGAAVAVLVVACPCALGLATPTALLVGSGRGAQLGILITGPEVLEQTRRATTVVLDKTGTITEGRMSVADDGGIGDDLLRLAGAAAAANDHPVSRAIAAHARARLGELPEPAELRVATGQGVTATVDGRRVTIERSAEPSSAAGTAVRLSADGLAPARLVLRDAIKPTSAAAIAQLRALGLSPVLVSGDGAAEAARVAAAVGIDRVVAEVLPETKAAEVARLRAAGEVVAVIGDGVNDAPALALADLGLAIGTGSDVAIEAADITLVSGDLRAAADAVRLARRTLATIKANLFWAFAYNVILIPLAFAGELNPMLAAAAMACSSLFVVANSLRLRRFRSSREEMPA